MLLVRAFSEKMRMPVMLKTRWTSAICTASLWCPDEARAASRLVVVVPVMRCMMTM